MNKEETNNIIQQLNEILGLVKEDPDTESNKSRWEGLEHYIVDLTPYYESIKGLDFGKLFDYESFGQMKQNPLNELNKIAQEKLAEQSASNLLKKFNIGAPQPNRTADGVLGEAKKNAEEDKTPLKSGGHYLNILKNKRNAFLQKDSIDEVVKVATQEVISNIKKNVEAWSGNTDVFRCNTRIEFDHEDFETTDKIFNQIAEELVTKHGLAVRVTEKGKNNDLGIAFAVVRYEVAVPQ